MLEDAGFRDVEIGEPYDTFADAGGEVNARTFDLYGYVFSAHRA
jgi:hypothetical protein